MISLSLQNLAAVLGAEAQPLPEIDFSGVTSDSRADCGGKLFVAIRGENFDGHHFVEAAFANGAVAALVEQSQAGEMPQIQVDDCVRAIGRLANHWRRSCDPRVIALTGSNGKTTVKEMLYRILSAQAPTLATRGNLNNEIGVPLTLFELGPEQDYAIVEMGANHRGEIARLAEIAEPDIVYVNNAAAAHLEGFGDLQGVIEAKGELYAWCGPEQLALFNADEEASRYWRSLCAAQTQLTCALDRDADVGARWSASNSGLEIQFSRDGEVHGCELEVFGEHNVRNALAAVSLALLAGIDFAEATASLAGFSAVRGRLQMLPGPGQSRLLDDSYNANPESLLAGIKVLCALEGKPWLALGDMAELGDDAAELHRGVGLHAREHGVEKMFCLGPLSRLACEAFGDSGASCDDIDDMADRILAQIQPGVNLLVKGSRAAGMERLVARLMQSENGGDANAV